LNFWKFCLLCDYGPPACSFENNALSEQELQQFIEAMKAERIKNTSTPEQAEQFLKELGFLDENGELSEKYAKSTA